MIGGPASSATPFTGNIHEILHYSTSLTTQNITGISNYLYNKWYGMAGIYLPKLWVRMDELAGLSHNADVTNWPGVTNGYNATGVAVGTGGNPKYFSTGQWDSFPFVRLGTGTNSSTNGNYFSFGTQALNIGDGGGFSFAAMVRFYSLATFERLFDFGNGQDNNNILCYRTASSADFAFNILNGSTQYFINLTPISRGWMILSGRINSSQVSFNESGTPVTASYSGLANRTLTNMWVGRSNWSTDGYANMDLRELLIYDRSLTDAELGYLRIYLQQKYSPTPGIMRGLKVLTYDGGYFNDDPNWFATATVTATRWGVTNFSNTSNATRTLKTTDSGDNFSVQWLGYFLAVNTGLYYFYTESDDASYLWIGDIAAVGYTTVNALVNNAGIHGVQSRSGSIYLTGGRYYPLRIQYGDQSSGNDIRVSFAPPGINQTYDLSGYVFCPEDAPMMSGLGLWLNANVFNSITTVSSAVSTWIDISGNGRDFSQSTTSLRPTYNATSFNGAPCLEINVSNGGGLLRNANVMGTLASSTTGSAFVVSESSAVNSQWSIFFKNWHNVSNNDEVRRFHWSHSRAGNNGQTLFLGNNAGFVETGSSTTANNTRYVSSFVFNGANISSVQTINGTAYTFTINDTFTNSSTNANSLFGVGDTRATYSCAKVAEVIMFDRALTVTERQSIENYLRNKYNL
jgi:hypothetical protein